MVVAAHQSPFGRYVLTRRLAQGGMGEVFLAQAHGADGFRKPVVIKRILRYLAGDSSFVDLLAAEARLMTSLAHPNVVQVIDFGRGEAGDCFLVLELVDGVDLRRFLSNYQSSGSNLPIGLALHIASQALRGLHHAHEPGAGGEHGLVHRDVSPGNILLSRVGEVKVADFGVALASGTATGGSVVGKPRYMAPEQLDAQQVDRRADVFSMGVVLFEVLTGELPYAGSDESGPVTAGLALRSVPLCQLRPDLPVELEEVLSRACAMDAASRFPTARAFAQALAALRSSGVVFADADELADAVAARCPVAEGVPVQQLGGAIPVEALEPTRVTAVDPGGGFTLELGLDSGPDVPSLVTERLAAAEPPSVGPAQADPDEAPPRRGSGLSLWRPGVVAAVSLLAAVGLGIGASRGLFGSTEAPPVASLPSVTLAAPDVPESAVSVVLESSPLPPRASATAPPAPSPGTGSPKPGLLGSRPLSSVPPVSAPPVSAPPALCFGTLQLFSSHSWQVSGGPAAVQSPGRYRWPCGTYPLAATSRLDAGRTRRRTVTIADGRSVTFDLR